jgi:hypothetical protein
MVVFTPLLIAKAALTAGKMVADTQRTASDPRGEVNLPSFKNQKEKPEKESKDDIKGQMNGKTQSVGIDKDGKTSVGDATSNNYQGGTDTMTAYQKRKKYGNPYA